MSNSSSSSNPSIKKVSHKHNDYSCYIHIINKSESALQLVNSKAITGRWAKASPPKEILPNSNALIELTDPKGPTGSEGWCKYRLEHPQKSNTVSFTLRFGDPYWARDDNFLQATTTYTKWISLNVLKYQTNGHPFIAYVEVDLLEHHGLDRRISHRSQKSVDTTISELSGFSDVQGLPEYEAGSHSPSVASEKKKPIETVCEIESKEDDDVDDAVLTKPKLVVSFHDDEQDKDTTQDHIDDTADVEPEIEPVTNHAVEEWPQKLDETIDSRDIVDEDDNDDVAEEQLVPENKQPETKEPASTTSKVEEPEVKEPVVQQPEHELSEVTEPKVDQLEDKTPAVDNSTHEETEIVKDPVDTELEDVESTAADSNVEQPTVEQPTVEQPTVEQPTVEQPTAEVQDKPVEAESEAADEATVEADKVDMETDDDKPQTDEFDQARHVEDDQAISRNIVDETHESETKTGGQDSAVTTDSVHEAEGESKIIHQEESVDGLSNQHEKELKDAKHDHVSQKKGEDLEVEDEELEHENNATKQPATVEDEEEKPVVEHIPAEPEQKQEQELTPILVSVPETVQAPAQAQESEAENEHENFALPSQKSPPRELEVEKHVPHIDVKDEEQHKVVEPQSREIKPEVEPSEQEMHVPTKEEPQSKDTKTSSPQKDSSAPSETTESSYWTTVMESPNAKIGAVAFIFLASYGFTALRISRGLLSRN